MKVKQIRLKNGYKRFHDTIIDLGENPKRIVALIGPNGSGKSSAFDGMLYLANAHVRIGDQRIGTDPNYHSSSTTAPVTHNDIELELDAGDYRAVYAEKQKTGQQNTIISFRSPYRYNSNLKVKETKATPDISENNYGASFTHQIDEKMENNYRRLNAKYNKYLNDNDCKPSEAKAHLIGELNASIENCLDIRIDNLGNIDANQGSLYFTKYDQNTPFEFNVLSSGEKEVVDLLLDLYLRQEKFSDTIFVIDEPELHVNTSIQKNLLIEINRLIGDDCQIWLASHSIGLMRALQTEFKDISQIIYFEPGLRFAERQIKLTPVKRTVDVWKKIFSTALDDLTNLVSPRQIVYCEGRDAPGPKGKERGLDARIYNRVFGSEFPETLFVSSGGNTELDQRSDIAIKILSKAIADLEVLILKDRDFDSAKLATLEDREVYLASHPNHHRVLMRFEMENYLFDKETLKAFCDATGREFKEETYDDLVNDIVNQNIKDEIVQIKRICGLDDNYGTDQLKLELAGYLTPDTNVYSELKNAVFG